MNRKNILRRLGTIAIVLTIIVSVLNSCTKADQASQVNFTIDLTQPQYGALNAIGGYVVINNVIIAKDQANNYIAVSAYCTYDATPLTFNGSYNLFVCPSCNSQFNINGTAGIGRATQPLVVYTTVLIGSSLQVHS